MQKLFDLSKLSNSLVEDLCACVELYVCVVLYLTIYLVEK